MNISIDTIVVPQGAEHQAVCRGLSQANCHNIQVIPIPIGTNKIEETLASYSLKLANSQRILIMGLCGSLAQQHSVGDTVLYQKCWHLNHENLNLESELIGIIQDKLSVNLVTGLTSDRPICQGAEKLQLSQVYPVSVVDMEGYGYIRGLQQLGKSIAMVRVVSDDLAGDIPDLSKAIDDDGNLKTWAMAIAFLRQPIAATRLIKGSLTGLKVLQKITIVIFSQDLSFLSKEDPRLCRWDEF